MISNAKQLNIHALAEHLTKLHRGHATQRILSKGHDLVGLAGEKEFGIVFDLMPDVQDRPKGDAGIDFILPFGTLDVKTYRKPFNLLHERGKFHADIFVLAGFNDKTNTAHLIGWCLADDVETWPYRDFGYGVINHYKPAEKLLPIQQLLDFYKLNHLNLCP